MSRKPSVIAPALLATLLIGALRSPAPAQIPAGVVFETFYDTAGTGFNHPTFVGGVPGDPDQLVVVERPGGVHRLVRTGTRFERRAWFSVDANTATHWDGAWAVEFHPRFAQNRLFYVLYRLKGADTRSVIEEWTCDAGMANPRKVRNILHFAQKSIHSSGDIKFGPDGFLYSAQGDRNQKGPQGGQLMSELWGKVIRIDVDRKDPGLEYAIPADNPFRTQAGMRPEIWASGFRMPYRISFDRLTGDLYLGDVGDAIAEEVDIVKPGANYGSGTVEGTCKTGCQGLTDPVLSLPRGCVIGGFVYRNDPASAFYGAYIFADYQTNKLSALKLNPAKTGVSEWKHISAATPGRISAMGQDAAGNFYAATYLEEPEQSRTHVFRLKHAELRPAPVALRGPVRPPAGHGPRAWAAAGFRLHGLDGKAHREGGERTPGVLLARDPATGAVRRLVDLP